MKIHFEAYCYDMRKAELYGEDPYSVSYAVDCETLEEAANLAVYDFKDYCKNDWEDYGGAIVAIDGEVVYDALRNGDIEFTCPEFENMFRAKL